MERKIKLKLISSVLVIISGLLFIWFELSPKNEPTTEIQQTSLPPATSSATLEVKSKQQRFLVTRVIDGDTIELSTGQKVRLVGIDTPETVDPRRSVGCFGKQASSQSKKLVEGKEVILERDVSETDKYNRLLRYVYLPLADGSLLFVNDYLVREGFARVYTYPPDIKFNEQFLQAEREARSENRGLWAACPAP